MKYMYPPKVCKVGKQLYVDCQALQTVRIEMQFVNIFKTRGAMLQTQRGTEKPAAIKGLPLSTSAPRGGGGVCPKADIVLEISKGGCVILRTRGGRGSKNPKFLRTYLMEAP